MFDSKLKDHIGKISQTCPSAGKPRPRILILGEYHVSRPPRASIMPSLEHAAAALGLECEAKWVNERALKNIRLNDYDGLFIGPGGADEDIDHILSAITVSREQGIPTLGTCGGFQRMVAEIALNILGFQEIVHQETDPEAENALFTDLMCQMVGDKDWVIIQPETRAGVSYGVAKSQEYFYCQFGVNPDYVPRFIENGLVISAVDSLGSPRIIELKEHPFFVGTLFVPQVQSALTEPHPLIKAFLLAASKRVRRS